MELSDHGTTDMSGELEMKVLAQAEELRLVRAQLDDVLRRVAALESRGTRRSALPQRQASASSLRSDSPPPATPPPVASQSQSSVATGPTPTSAGSLATSKRWSSTGDFNQQRHTPHARLAAAKSLFNLSPGPRPPAHHAAATLEADWSETERCIRVGGVSLLAPTDAVVDTEAVAPLPLRRLRVAWVHGFRGRDARSCLHLLPTGETVYWSACVVVLHCLAESTQRHYQGHSDAVLCLAVHPNRMTLASAQGGQQPHVRVWDSVSLATVACVGLGHFEFPVRCVGFSKADGGAVLCAVDDSPDHVLSLWAWQRGTLIAHAKGSCESVTWAEFHPLDAAVVTAGKNHLAFWTAHGTTLFKMAAVFDARLRPKFVTAVAFAQSGAAVSGDSNGNVTLWTRGGPLSSRCSRAVVPGGPVLSLLTLRDGRVLAGGGKDGRLVLLDDQLRVVSETALPSDVGGVRAVVEARQGRIIVGTTRNCVLEGPLSGPLSVVVRGHADTVVALATHPSRAEFAAAGLDGLAVMRDAETHEPIGHLQLPAGCHSLDYSPDGSQVLAGLTDGRWLLFPAEGGGGGGGGATGAAPLTACAFSPDGRHLALGSADGSVYLNDSAPRFERIGRCLGHTGAVAALDWSQDGQLLRSNTDNGELLFWSSSSCRQVLASSRPRDAVWASHRCTLSFDSAGAALGHAPYVPGHAHRGAGLLAAGGGRGGGLRLMGFPARPKALAHRYGAHTTVAQLRFDHDGSRLVSAGGEDGTVVVWDVQ